MLKANWPMIIILAVIFLFGVTFFLGVLNVDDPFYGHISVFNWMVLQIKNTIWATLKGLFTSIF